MGGPKKVCIFFFEIDDNQVLGKLIPEKRGGECILHKSKAFLKRFKNEVLVHAGAFDAFKIVKL